MSVHCPGCGGSRIRERGPIPLSDAFAGQRVAPMPAVLARCRDCRLGFRHPQPPRAQLDALYRAGSEQAWSEMPALRRRDWELATDRIRALGARSVLDVGCWDGQFLAGLPEGVVRKGVEIHPAAAARAEASGTHIVGRNVHDLAAIDPVDPVDVVTAFDVMEHVHDPGRLLRTLAELVRPGGHVIFATGNLDAPTFRLVGRRHLYCWFQEHIAFVSPAWTEEQAAGLGLELVEVVRFGHAEGGLVGSGVGMLKTGVQRWAPRLAGRLRDSRGPAPVAGSPALPAPPAWPARDHFVAVLRRGDDDDTRGAPR